MASPIQPRSSKSEVNLEDLFQLSVDMLGAADLKGNLIEVNPAWKDTLGYSRDELIGTLIIDLVHAEDRDKTERSIAQVATETKAIEIQSRFQCKDETYKWLSWNAVPHLEADMFYFSARDITLSKQIETDLDQHLERLNLLRRIDVELSKKLDLDYVLLIGLDHALRICNADTGFICLITLDGGLSIAQSIGGYGIGNEPPYIDDNGIIRATLEKQRPQWYQDIEASEQLHSVVDMKSQLSIPLFANNELMGAICVEASDTDRFSYDISNFLQLVSVYIGIALNNAQLIRSIDQSRALYHTLIRNLPGTIVLLFDHDLRYQLVEGSALKAIGYSKESLEGKTIWEALPRPAAEKLAPMYRLALEGEGVHFEYQSLDRKHTFDLQIVPLVDAQGNIEQALAVAHDVTDLQNLISELDSFSGTVAHDLKSPLNLIIGYTSMLLKDKSISPDTLESLQVVAKTGHKMSQIISELLQMASLRKMDEVPMEPLDLSSIVAEVCSRLRFMIDEYQPIIVEPDLWETAIGYAPWVEEIYANYVSNAMKYGGEPPQIELGSTPLPNNKVKLWVRDNGKGLTKEEQNKLFSEFSRLEPKRVTGHGLGLSIVKRIVEKMEGEVGIESTLGEGSIFYFMLPMDDLPSW